MPIKADFRRGCARYISGKLVENYLTVNQLEHEKQHIDRRSRMRISKETKSVEQSIL